MSTAVLSSPTGPASTLPPSSRLKQNSPASLARQSVAGQRAVDSIEINGQKLKRSPSRSLESYPLKRMQAETKRYDHIQSARKKFLGQNKIALMQHLQKGIQA